MDYISNTEAACDESRVSINCRVPNTACLVVIGISEPDKAASQPRSELIDEVGANRHAIATLKLRL
ncbi:hypothetical protein [Mesorhizobium sp. M7A.F.Ca.US.006.04.2.1]|uniref:hypothetical protein n=1 Tax=Mesorhizobium sp. M7A.F.Ca.US.006.04.2.1 TaxID=2496696 RepID=UPI001FE06D79|nr:hypothetical protein [Mesorhizobium sp. M7A.F.Ca.US.006.04.2.1]